MESVDSLPGQHGEVVRPECPVVEPRLVFDVADERSTDGADCVRGLFDFRLGQHERPHRVGGVLDTVQQFEQRVREAARVVAARNHRRPLSRRVRHEGQRLGGGW